MNPREAPSRSILPTVLVLSAILGGWAHGELASTTIEGWNVSYRVPQGWTDRAYDRRPYRHDRARPSDLHVLEPAAGGADFVEVTPRLVPGMDAAIRALEEELPGREGRVRRRTEYVDLDGEKLAIRKWEWENGNVNLGAALLLAPRTAVLLRAGRSPDRVDALRAVLIEVARTLEAGELQVDESAMSGLRGTWRYEAFHSTGGTRSGVRSAAYSDYSFDGRGHYETSSGGYVSGWTESPETATRDGSRSDMTALFDHGGTQGTYVVIGNTIVFDGVVHWKLSREEGAVWIDGSLYCASGGPFLTTGFAFEVASDIQGELKCGVSVKRKTGQHANAYSWKVRAGTRYRVSIESGDFEPEVKVTIQRKAEDALVYSGDRVIFTPAADGEVTIVATSESENEHGGFRVLTEVATLLPSVELDLDSTPKSGG